MFGSVRGGEWEMYGFVFDFFGLFLFESGMVVFVLEVLGSNEFLDFGGFGVRFFVFIFGLNFVVDDVFVDLFCC